MGNPNLQGDISLFNVLEALKICDLLVEKFATIIIDKLKSGVDLTTLREICQHKPEMLDVLKEQSPGKANSRLSYFLIELRRLEMHSSTEEGVDDEIANYALVRKTNDSMWSKNSFKAGERMLVYAYNLYENDGHNEFKVSRIRKELKRKGVIVNNFGDQALRTYGKAGKEGALFTIIAKGSGRASTTFSLTELGKIEGKRLLTSIMENQ